MTAPASFEVPWLLRAAIQQYGRAVRRELAANGYGDIPPRGQWLLAAIDRASGSAPPSALVEQLGITKQAVSQIGELLVTLGYLRRDPDRDDRRRLLLSLTDRGGVAARIIAATSAGIGAGLEAQLGTETNDLTRLLRQAVRIVASW